MRRIVLGIVNPALIFMAFYALGAINAESSLGAGLIVIAVLYAAIQWGLEFVILRLARALENEVIAILFVYAAPATALGLVAWLTPVVFPGILLALLFSVIFNWVEETTTRMTVASMK